MSQEELFMRLMEDESVKQLVKQIGEKTKEYGDDGDQFMTFLIGVITNFFSSNSVIVSTIEELKFTVMMRAYQESTQVFSDYVRRKEPEKMKPT